MNGAGRSCCIAVAGGGSVAISFLSQLLLMLRQRPPAVAFSVLIMDPRPRTGSGLPYQPGDKTALLNTRTGTTSALCTNRQHFHEWLLRHADDLKSDYVDLDLTPEGFVPRSVFGRYLESLYVESLEAAHEIGVRIKRVFSALRRAEMVSGGRIRLCTDGAENHLVDRLVICTGNPPGRLYEDLLPTLNYFHHPYPADRVLSRIPAGSRVCVIGSGLTATDTVIALANQNQVTSIDCMSRNGRVQAVKSASSRQPILRHITPDNLARLCEERGRKLSLDELATMFMQEVEIHSGRSFDLSKILLPHLTPLEYISHEIETAMHGAKPWQAVLYAINDVIEFVWHYLSDEGRSEFLERYRTDFMSYKVAIPLQNARILQRLLASGKLRVFRSRDRIRYCESYRTYKYSVEDPLTGEVEEATAEYVVNATGFSNSYFETTDALISSLVAQGMATPSKFGGLNVDFRTSNLLDRSGAQVANISCLGTLASGAYFWTAAMDVNSKIAYRLAARIIDEQGQGR